MSPLHDIQAPGERQGVLRPPDGDDEIDLGQLLGVLWAGRYRIVLSMILAGALGVFFIANTAPTYQADALLQLEERSGRMALPAGMRDLIDNDPRTITEIEIIRSRMVLGQVVADLNLDWQVRPKLAPLIGTLLARYPIPLPDHEFLAPYARPGEALTLSLLQVPPHWLNTMMELEVTPRGFLLTDPSGRRWPGVPGETLHDADLGFALRVETLEAPAGRVFLIEQRSEISAINQLRSALTVSERGRQSGVLEVRLQAPDRADAVRMLNSTIQAYARQNIARSAAEAESGLSFIEAQLPEAEAAVRQAERALNAYRQQQASVDLSFETQNLLTQVTRIEAELRELQAREDELSQRYTTSHPVYQQLLAERGRLQERQERLRAEIGALPETQREVLNLTRDLEMAQEIYTQFLTRAQEMQVLRASTVGNVRIVDSAAASENPVAPRRQLILVLAVVLGALAGSALVLLREWMRRGIQSAEELEKAGLPVFATINYTPHADLKHKRKGKLPILAIDEPADLAVEGLRSLRTSLHFGMIDARTRSLAITSSAPEIGKSFTALNLAVVAAQAGQRVCIVDADLRRGQLRRYFDQPRNQPGLAEVLAGASPLDTALQRDILPNLAFLPSGRYPPNPSELLMRSEFSAMLKMLDTEFDLTIFDCPPVLAVTDPVIIGRSAGALILIARYDQTPIAEVEAVRKTFSAAGVRLSGTVLNAFDPRKARRGHGYSYGYSYRYQYQARKE